MPKKRATTPREGRPVVAPKPRAGVSVAPAVSRAAIGFTVKSGWAAVVLLTGSVSAPRVADSRRIELSDPAVPESRQPYHAGFSTARERGPKLSRLLGSVGTFGRRSVCGLIDDYTRPQQQVTGAGLVVGSLADPEAMTNEHIRIHALEGQLFRGVVTEAVAARGLSCAIWRERDLYAAAAASLQRTEHDLHSTVTSLGRAVEGGWRAEQKAATLAAWLVLASHPARPPRARDRVAS